MIDQDPDSVGDAKLAVWPPLLSTRERLTLAEAAAGLFGRTHLEDSLASHLPAGRRSVTMTTYGKGAFELAVRDARLAGTKVILPAFISHDFVGVFKKYDITPVFVDVDPGSFQVVPEACDTGLLETARALVILHTFGLPSQAADAFRDLCDHRGLMLIEDCARALGGRADGKLVGAHGDYAVFSLSKVAPIRRGGLLISRRQMDVALGRGAAGLSGFVNALLLLKVPGMSALEGPLYRYLRETPVYPGEIGLYDPPAVERPEAIVDFFLAAFMPHYGDAMHRKRAIALEIRQRLELLGFSFQHDPGNHIYTALGALVPPGVSRAGLRAHLRTKAVNAYTLWPNPLGTSPLAAEAWGTDPTAFPVTAHLAKRLIHFPINRFMRGRDVDRLCTACEEYVGA